LVLGIVDNRKRVVAGIARPIEYCGGKLAFPCDLIGGRWAGYTYRRILSHNQWVGAEIYEVLAPCLKKGVGAINGGHLVLNGKVHVLLGTVYCELGNVRTVGSVAGW
jgi:hypothetical protein